MLNIPEDFIDFLYWIKENTEKLWSEDLEISGCEEWIHGAKWIGMNDAEIDEVEIYKSSSQLLPIHAHWFLLSDPLLKQNPVLSIFG